MPHDGRLDEAERLARAGDLRGAIALWQEALGAAPENDHLLNRLGDAYARIGNDPRARDSWSRAAEQLALRGFHLKAIPILRKIQKLDPEDVALAERIADLWARARRVVEADAELRSLGEQLVRSGQLRRAVPVFRKIAEIDPSDVNSQITLAHVLSEIGSAAEAAECSANIAESLLAGGHAPEAIAQWRRAVELAPDVSGHRARLADVLVAAGDHDGAVAELRHLVRLRPDDAAVLVRLRGELLAAGRCAEAAKVFDDLAGLSPQNESTRLARAEQRLAAGDPEGAFDLLFPLAEKAAKRGNPLRAALLLARVAEAEPASVRALRAENAWLLAALEPEIERRREELDAVLAPAEESASLAAALAAAERSSGEPDAGTAAEGPSGDSRYDLVLELDADRAGD